MRKIIFIVFGTILTLIVIVALAGMYKFNYLANQPGYDVDGNELKYPNEYPLCDSTNGRYRNKEEAFEFGLSMAEFGATFCPEYKMHPSWDADNDGLNDCYEVNNCDSLVDYFQPKGIPSMHSSWDLDKDGINDCEKEGICDDSVDYSQPKQSRSFINTTK